MSWESEACPNCGVTNWIDTGDPQDMTGRDVSAAKCYACDHSWWLYDASDDTDGTAADNADEGKSCPDYFVSSVHADHLYQVQRLGLVGGQWHDVEEITKDLERAKRTKKHLSEKAPEARFRIVCYERKSEI